MASKPDTMIGDIRHIAISADGNGRWATRRGLPRTAGHAESQLAFEAILAACVELHLPYLSLHVFSSENWTRPAEEIEYLATLFTRVLVNSTATFDELGVRFRWVGSPTRLPEQLLRVLTQAEDNTAANSGLSLQFCLNYGGRAEIVDAALKLAEQRGSLTGPHSDEQTFRSLLYAPDVPDVDLYIRPAGEHRFSNFLIWQCAYAELYFTDTLWPDFRRDDLMLAISEYKRRKRTLGGVE